MASTLSFKVNTDLIVLKSYQFCYNSYPKLCQKVEIQKKNLYVHLSVFVIWKVWVFQIFHLVPSACGNEGLDIIAQMSINY